MRPPPPAWTLDAQDMQRLEELLNDFLRDSNARCAVLVDRVGRLLAAAGETAGLDGTTFASLAAADFGASDQLALLLGEAEFSALYHHGEKGSMYLLDVPGQAILAAIFDQRTTLGMVRLKSRALVPAFARLLEEAASRPRTSPRLDLGGAWLGDAESEIDRLFGE